MLMSNNSLVKKNYFDSNIIWNENARILGCLQMDYFEADVARNQMFRSYIIKARNMHVEH